jgi:hypothetical protein
VGLIDSFIHFYLEKHQMSKGPVRNPRTPLPEISIPGDVLMRRELFARTVLGVHEKTAARMNLPTVYVSGIAYIARGAAIKSIADQVRCRRQPAKRRAAVA